MVQVHRTGLTRLSPTEDQSNVKPRFNIIFIHGLRGHPRKTWEGRGTVKSGADSASSKPRRGLLDRIRGTPKTPDEGDNSDTTSTPTVFWPEELLANDVPSATVWTYGYNADVIGMFAASNKNSISQHGQDLKIALERDIDNKDPTVFLAHSLGGIVLKDAIQRSEKFQEQTKFILFLGTPHRGSPTASMGKIASNMARLALQDSNKNILNTLEIDSEILDRIHNEFINIAVSRGFVIHSFYEARGITGVKGLSGKIVNDFSSKLGLPGNETVESIDADHRQMARCSRREDETYRKVLGELSSKLKKGVLDGNLQPPLPLSHVQQEPAASRVQERRLMIPFVSNQDFIGRAEKLTQLETKLFVDKIARRLAVFGLGGVGKTQLALAFCNSIKAGYHDYSIFWISALSKERFVQDYMKIAKSCALSIKPSEEDTMLLVQEYLNSEASGKWLLVVDNADDKKILFDDGGIASSLPRGENGITLFTTRYKDVAFDLAGKDIVSLEGMSFIDARNFLAHMLTGHTMPDDEGASNALLEQLEFLPLAIVQASSYIIKRSITITKYLSLMKMTDDKVIKLLNHSFQDDTRDKAASNPVALTWLVSFEQIEREEPKAAELLYCIACLENRSIPLSILPSESESDLTDLVGILLGYSFISKQKDNETYDMHRLVHHAIKFWMRENGLVDHWSNETVSRLANIFPWGEWQDRSLWQEYTPHAYRILQGSTEMPSEDRATLCLRFGRCLRVEGRYAEAVTWISECVKWRREFLSVDDPGTLTAEHELAAAYQFNNQINEAVDIVEKVIAIHARVQAEDHPDRLASQHALAVAYQSNGQSKEAVEMLKKVVAIHARVLAEDHPGRLASQHALAMAYKANGQIQEALVILEKVAAIRGRVQAEDHPGRLASQAVLAGAYKANGQIQEAVGMLEKVVAIRVKVLAEDNPHRLTSQNILAGYYEETGRLDEAIHLRQHVLAVQEKSLPVEHPDRLTSQHNLADSYRETGRIEEAIRLEQHVVAVQEKSLPVGHPDRLTSQHNLAFYHRKAGRFEEAIHLMQHVVAVREKSLPVEHPDRLLSQHNLAMYYQEAGRLEEAIYLMQHVVAVREKSLPVDHLSRLASQHNLAVYYQEAGRLEEAISLMQHVVAVHCKSLEPSHPDRQLSESRLSRWLIRRSSEDELSEDMSETGT